MDRVAATSVWLTCVAIELIMNRTLCQVQWMLPEETQSSKKA